jgi:hypothetical protein
MRKLLISTAGTAFVNLILAGAAVAQSLFGVASVQPADPPPFDVGAATLYRINATTGAATRIGSILGFDNVDGIAFHPVTGVLYGVGYRRPDNAPVLLKINKANGQGSTVTTIKNPSGAFFCSPVGTACTTAPDDIAFHSDGRLFALFGAHLATINITTGAATLVRAFAVINGFALNLTMTPSDELSLIDAEVFRVNLDPDTGDTISTEDFNFAFPGATFYALAWGPGIVVGTKNASCCVSTGLDLVFLGRKIVPTVAGLEALAWSRPNTPVGANVAVSIAPEVASIPPVTLTFDNVTQEGETTVEPLAAPPPAPPGLKAASIFDAATTAQFTGNIGMCLDYTDLGVVNEDGLRLLHFEASNWVDIAVSHDPAANIICGSVTSLSPFGLFETGVEVPFDALTARVEIEGDELEMKGAFTLGAASNGIDPQAEVVSLQVGSFSTTIPAGSFRSDKKGRFKFEGVVDGVELEVMIRPLDAARFELKAEAEGSIQMGTVSPIPVNLTIGDDAGATVVNPDFEDDDDDHDGDHHMRRTRRRGSL